jgi:hypothetical protein
VIKFLVDHDLIITVISLWFIIILLLVVANKQFPKEKHVDINIIRSIFSIGLLTFFLTFYVILK